MLTVHNFHFGLLTPVLAVLVGSLGLFLGLRATARARACRGSARARWLGLGAVSAGSTGIWVAHFVAMLGLTIPGTPIRYSIRLTALSLLVAVAALGAGLLLAGLRGARPASLALASLIAGAGIAGSQYLALIALQVPVRVSYDPARLAGAVIAAVAAALVLVWAALRWQRSLPALGAAGVAAALSTGVYYLGTAAARLTLLPHQPALALGGVSALVFLAPVMIGTAIVTFAMVSILAISPTTEEIRDEAELLERSRARGLEI